VRKVDPNLAPISTSLDVRGVPGLTAYFGLLEIGQPRPGEPVVVSGAAGAVGSIVGQVAKLQGCRVVGIAGSDQKVDWITRELGFDAAFNYKTTPDLIWTSGWPSFAPKALTSISITSAARSPTAVFKSINVRARIVVCGQISQYNADKPPTGPRLLGHLIVKQAKAEGFLVFQYSSRYGEGLKLLANGSVQASSSTASK